MISLITAMEIYGNPDDLCFFIPELDNSQFGFTLTRGPGHNFKIMFSSNNLFNSREQVLGIVKKILEMTLNTCNPDKENKEFCLTQEKIDEILKGLEKGNQVNTF